MTEFLQTTEVSVLPPSEKDINCRAPPCERAAQKKKEVDSEV